jgi:predicted Zn-dependent protease
LRQLGELDLQSGEYVKAAEYLGRAREVRPDDATAAYYHGEALQKTGDLAGARDALEASLKLQPGQLPARLLLGEVYLGLKNPQAAEDQFEAALLLDPKSAQAQLDLAKVSLQAKPAEAVQQLESFTKAHPDSIEAFDLLAQTYRRMGNEAAAQEAENKAKALRKQKPAS